MDYSENYVTPTLPRPKCVCKLSDDSFNITSGPITLFGPCENYDFLLWAIRLATKALMC